MAKNNCVECGGYHNESKCPECGCEVFVSDENFLDDEEKIYKTENDFLREEYDEQ